ncbi:DNA primase [Phytomonospora sp. NPDC050363]|uniref:DNA primase n=1 Tax=Phytomonospora sp. NPDC050363 TaxID=3155642 RepID=UPI0033C432D8
MGRHSSEEDGAQPDALDADGTPERDREADEFWDLVNVDPVEIALSKGVGYTLRAYVTVESAADEDEEVEEAVEEDEESPTETEEVEAADAEDTESDEDDDEPRKKGKDVKASDDADEDEELEEEEEEEIVVAAPKAEIAELDIDEAPRFLTADGKLLLFETPELLTAFVRENHDHDLADLDKWDEVVAKIKPEWVVPGEEDSYELDLVVENLRGGHDVWDHDLIISAGELARDLGYALHLKSVLTALAPGSPIDDLDDALRAVEAGGFGGFFAKRRLRKIGAQQASLAWRSIIGKISAAVDWRK